MMSWNSQNREVIGEGEQEQLVRSHCGVAWLARPIRAGQRLVRHAHQVVPRAGRLLRTTEQVCLTDTVQNWSVGRVSDMRAQG